MTRLRNDRRKWYILLALVVVKIDSHSPLLKLFLKNIVTKIAKYKKIMSGENIFVTNN